MLSAPPTRMLAVDAPWLPGVLPFITAFVVCTLVVPLTVRLAHRVGAVDQPDDQRRIHTRPTPRLGGIAMFAGFAVALLLFGGSIPTRTPILLSCGVITMLMAIDDARRLPWLVKLGIQVATGVLVSATGITIAYVAIPGFTGQSAIELGVLAVPVTIMWVVGMENAINLLDGSDGVAAGVVGIVAVVTLLAAINRLGATSGPQDDVIRLSGALMGCCLGFLIENTAPARVFMGDSGSHFLGMAMALITILGVAKVTVALSLSVPLIALGLPLYDTGNAIYRRRRQRRSIAEPDRGHLHHRLLALGLSPRETALAFYLATGILGSFSLELFGHQRIILVGLFLLVVSLVLLIWRNHRRGPVEERADYAPLPSLDEGLEFNGTVPAAAHPDDLRVEAPPAAGARGQVSRTEPRRGQ